MEVEKLRNLTDAELVHQQRELNDQLFRMKFQLKMGQTESLNKIRGLRKDVARIKTVMREKELGLTIESKEAEATPAAETTGTAKSAKPARVKKSAAARKTSTAKKTTATAKAKKKSTGATAKAKARKK